MHESKDYISMGNAIKKCMGKTMQEIADLQYKEKVQSNISELQVGSKKDKLTSKQIAKKIKKLGKSSTLAGWDKIFSKFSPKELHSKIDLEGMLPDYIAGKDIEAIFAEEVEEDADVTAGDVQGKDMPLGKKKVIKRKDLEESIKEGGHTDVASMKQKVLVGMKAMQTLQQELGKIPDEGSLPTWWTNKVAIAVDKLDGMADYLDTKIESVKIEENASMSSINDLVQDIKSKTVVYADVTQGSNQGHKFYLKGKPEIKAGDILLRMDSDKSQFIQVKIDQIKDIRTTKSMAGKNKAVSINLKK